MRIGKERKSPLKTDVPKLHAYNECEHSVKENGRIKGVWFKLVADYSANYCGWEFIYQKIYYNAKSNLGYLCNKINIMNDAINNVKILMDNSLSPYLLLL